MKTIDFHLDFLSPYAWLAFARLPMVMAGVSHRVNYRPLLLAGLLQHWGQKGPAEIEPKRAWTFRQVAWLAQRDGVVLQTPRQHPFNPLALLRLALACAPEGGLPSRWVCERLFRHVWCGEGADANDPARLLALQQELAAVPGGLRRDPQGPEVKQALRAATEAALAQGVFGVPTLVLDGRPFWGADGLEMLAAAARGDAWFDGPAWDEAGQTRPGVQRSG